MRTNLLTKMRLRLKRKITEARYDMEREILGKQNASIRQCYHLSNLEPNNGSSNL